MARVTQMVALEACFRDLEELCATTLARADLRQLCRRMMWLMKMLSESSPIARHRPDPTPVAKATPLTTAPARSATNGFDDDAWGCEAVASMSTSAATPAITAAPLVPAPAPEPPRPKVNDDIALLSITSPPLQPAQAPQPALAPAPAPTPVQPAPVANQAIF
ncbi:hypothetical protein MRB53_039939 [Persea americana]|nr:hypothetical protein MRB53_039939 [Persea americana]